VSAISLAEAVERVRAGGLIAYPTETVWALGADASQDTAVQALRRLKGRADDAPISVLVEAAAALPGQGFAAGRSARSLADRFWPGPLTLVMPCTRRLAPGIARADGAVGVRCSSHPIAAALAQRLAEAGAGPLTATSLNRSGEAPARTRAEAEGFCGDGPDAARLLDGAEVGGQAPSTVIDVCGAQPQVLRWGALREAQLAPFLEEIAAA
jgi:L-threonylcarbamoyladenylate synthase